MAELQRRIGEPVNNHVIILQLRSTWKHYTSILTTFYTMIAVTYWHCTSILCIRLLYVLGCATVILRDRLLYVLGCATVILSDRLLYNLGRATVILRDRLLLYVLGIAHNHVCTIISQSYLRISVLYSTFPDDYLTIYIYIYIYIHIYIYRYK